jgi:hypothetical protein
MISQPTNGHAGGLAVGVVVGVLNPSTEERRAVGAEDWPATSATGETGVWLTSTPGTIDTPRRFPRALFDATMAMTHPSS